MDRQGIPLLIVVVAIVVCGLGAGAGSFVQTVGGWFSDNWSPRDYVAKDGECFVLPQGDGVYDEHYAQEVNPFNCEAFETQSQAFVNEAKADEIRADTLLSKVAIFGFFGVLGVGAVLLLLMLLVRR